MHQIGNGVSRCSIDNISDYVLELIIVHVNSYRDLNHVLQVNKRWNRVGKMTIKRMKRLYYKCSNFSWRLLEDDSHLLSERCSHSACYYPQAHMMYMFGGCTSTYTAFNDLWLLDLSTRVWERVIISRPPLPSAKALASLTRYNDNLILYGGFSKSSTNPIHQTTTFYNEIHLYNKERNCWEEIICENTAPHLAGHTASIVGDFMLVFGGSMGSSYNNNVYVLDITRRIWNMPSIPGPCPPPRYGQSQILLDDRHLVIIGGCGGPSVMFCDVWLLDFDLCGDTEWKWTQLKVENLDLSPPYLWCHQACKVENNAVVMSRPTKYCIKRSRRRRASSQQSSARISSPDSPQDRRAVAAAFCSAALPHRSHRSSSDNCAANESDTVDECGNLAANTKKKPILLSSRSLDEQDRRDSGRSENLSAAEKSNNMSLSSSTAGSSSISQAGAGGGTSRLSIAKNTELHRACSIPAIIVGEIPKLIVTSSTDHHVHPQHSRFSLLSTDEGATGSSHSMDTFVEDKKSKCTSGPSKFVISSPFIQVSVNSKTSRNEMTNSTVSNDKYGHTDAVREFYLSLLKEEYHRLKIVEMDDNLKMNERLCAFLKERVPYLSTQERVDMISELLNNSNRTSEDDCATSSTRQLSQGRLSNVRNRISTNDDIVGACYFTNERDSLSGGASASSSTASLNRSSFYETSNSVNIFGQNYYRHMCAYVLRLHDAIEKKTVRWEQLPVEEDSPEDIILYSIVAARGELILFGGMQSDGGNGMDCLNVGMERHAMNSDTFILRPRYNEM